MPATRSSSRRSSESFDGSSRRRRPHHQSEEGQARTRCVQPDRERDPRRLRASERGRRQGPAHDHVGLTRRPNPPPPSPSDSIFVAGRDHATTHSLPSQRRRWVRFRSTVSDRAAQSSSRQGSRDPLGSLPVPSKKYAMTTSPAIAISAAFRTLALLTHQSIAALDALTAPSVPGFDQQPPQWDTKYNADCQPNGQAAVPRSKFYN